MVSAGEIPDVSRCPTPGSRSTPTTICSPTSTPYLTDWEHAGDLTDRARRTGRGRRQAAYMLPYGFYLRAMFYNKDLLKEAGVEDAADHARRVPRRRREGLGAPGQVRLLHARRPRRPQRLGDVRGDHGRRQRLLRRRRQVDLQQRRLGQGPDLVYRPLQGRPRPEGQRQLGLQRDRRRLLLRHLRLPRPGPRRAHRHRRADEARAVRRDDLPEGPGRQGLPDHRLRRLVDDGGEREQGPGLEAHRHPRRPGGQRRLEQDDRRPAGAQVGRERPLLPERGLQGLVRGARRPERGPDDHADVPRGVRLLQGRHGRLLRPEGAPRRHHAPRSSPTSGPTT